MAQFVLNIHDIVGSGKEFSFPIEPSWLEAELAGTDVRVLPGAPTGRLEVRTHRSGDDVVLESHIEAEIATDCVRCLGDAKMPVSTDVTVLMSPRSSAPAEEDDADELSPDELAREYYVGDEIVLDSFVREHILLEVPMQPLCAESCKGIEIPAHVRPPADFGKEAAVDSRFASLQALADKMKKG
ncbi:MAG: YceD family protein [Polyangiales bacterium]